MKKVNSVGKGLSKVERAYLAGLIDADGAIMAIIEPHREKRFRFRVRLIVKLTQKRPDILQWIKQETQLGRVRTNRTTFDWLIRDQNEIRVLLKSLLPFLRIKRKQAEIALKIADISIESKKNLIRVARLADTLSINNPRSRRRRKNFATMI